MKELNLIQRQLKVPKTNDAKNARGGVLYQYRSCEDILEALKAPLADTKCTLTLTDEVMLVGNRFYIKATATLTNEAGETASASAFAREPDTLATMSQPQVTGAASSYARKYALNGLFAIDDTKDADAVQQQAPQQQGAPFPPPQNAQQAADQLSPHDLYCMYAKPAIEQAQTREELIRTYNDYPALQGTPDFMQALTARRKALGIGK